MLTIIEEMPDLPTSRESRRRLRTDEGERISRPPSLPPSLAVVLGLHGVGRGLVSGRLHGYGLVPVSIRLLDNADPFADLEVGRNVHGRVFAVQVERLR